MVLLQRVRLDPPLPTTAAAGFSQRLVLRNASVVITSAGTEPPRDRRTVTVFVDANAPALRLQAVGGAPFGLHASLEVWRNETGSGFGSWCQAWNRSADVVIADADGAIAVAHPNPDATADAVVETTLRRQGIDMGGQRAYNPMKGRTFGAWVSSGDVAAMPLRRVNSTTLGSVRPATEHTLVMSALTTVVGKPFAGPKAAAGKWAVAAAALAKANTATPFTSAAAAHTAEWRKLWNRSWVRVSAPGDTRHQPGDGNVTGDPTAMLTLQRYLDLANGRLARYPIHGGGQAS